MPATMPRVELELLAVSFSKPIAAVLARSVMPPKSVPNRPGAGEGDGAGAGDGAWPAAGPAIRAIRVSRISTARFIMKVADTAQPANYYGSGSDRISGI
jgi:hypothetical protein